MLFKVSTSRYFHLCKLDQKPEVKLSYTILVSSRDKISMRLLRPLTCELLGTG